MQMANTFERGVMCEMQDQEQEIRIRDVVVAVEALKRIQEMQLPGRLSYAISINLRRVDQVLDPFNKSRQDLIQQHGDPVEGAPDQYQIRQAEMDEWQAEMDDLLDATAGITPYLISPDLLDKVDEIPPRVLTETWFIWAQPADPAADPAAGRNGHRQKAR